jgi:hypothetical protein
LLHLVIKRFNKEIKEEVERKVKTMEENYEEKGGKVGKWIQDNLRILISVLIVLAIAAGIYSYSKRTEAPVITEKQEQAEKKTVNDEEEAIVLDKEQNTKSETAEKKTETVASSQETSSSFIESAVKGEGRTHLARRALANYLEKNPDSSLTPEHKIYVEDYLQKNVSKKVSLHPGDSVEFSKSLIQDAISHSKNLNEKQLNNLHKYAVRVSSLT